jgi:hypothetical protein
MKSSEIEVEVRRQVENVVQVFESGLQELAAALEYQRSARQYDLMLLTLRSFASQALVLGQAAWRLDGDAAEARRQFGRCKEWMDFCWDALEGVSSAPERQKQRLASKMLLEPCLCLILSNERVTCERIWWDSRGDVFDPPDALVKTERPQAAFSLDLIGAMGKGTLKYDDKAYESAGRMTDLPTRGYEAMLFALHRGEAQALEAARSRQLEEFAKRRRNREAALNPWGYGEVAQAACFDVIATALSRLANWRGLQMSGEGECCPEAFLSI